MAKSRMLTDNEVRKITEDSLEFKAFAETLEEIISTSGTPLTIGVYGEWGSGKTSLMRLTEDILKSKKEIKTVWFDAWKFDKVYDLRVALIHAILKEMENDQSVGDEVKTKAKDLIKRVNWLGLGKVAISLGALLTAPQLSVIPLLSKLLLKDKEESLDISKLKEGILKEQVDKKTLDLIGDFENEFRDLTKEYVGKDGRLVVFIDDLDRCIPEKTIEILESIKLFLNVPLSVFVIGADKKVIVEGIRQKYGEKSEDWGVNYLEKIIQVPFRLPPLRKDMITECFIQGLDISEEIKEYADIIAEVGDNPRNIKRLLNSFELQRIIAERRDLEVEESILAKLTVIDFKWHDFYTNLINLYCESDKFNLIQYLEELSKYNEAERDKKLKEWKTVKKYFDDKNLMSFLEEGPQLFGVDLDDYIYLAGTTRKVVEIEEEIKEDALRYFDLGYASYDKGEYDKSIEHYTKAIELDPKYVYAYQNRGINYTKKGEYDRAIEDYTESIKLDPNDVDGYHGRGFAYDNKGEYDRAIEDYNKVIELDPKHAIVYNNRGLIYDNKGEYDRAIEDYNKAIEFDPKHVPAYNNLKMLLTRLNKHKELIPEKWDSSAIKQAIKISGLEKDQKDSILSLLKSLKT